MENDDLLLKFDAPCLVCGEPAHVVADPERRRARWCCTRCQALGSAPFVAPPSMTDLQQPVAQA